MPTRCDAMVRKLSWQSEASLNKKTSSAAHHEPARLVKGTSSSDSVDNHKNQLSLMTHWRHTKRRKKQISTGDQARSDSAQEKRKSRYSTSNEWWISRQSPRTVSFQIKNSESWDEGERAKARERERVENEGNESARGFGHFHINGYPHCS